MDLVGSNWLGGYVSNVVEVKWIFKSAKCMVLVSNLLCVMVIHPECAGRMIVIWHGLVYR